MQRVIISVTNDLSTDQRVDKVSNTLVKLGWDVTLVGRKKKDSLPLKKRKYKMKRMLLLFQKGPFFYAEYNIRLFLYLLFHKVDLLVSNDLDTLLANHLANKLKHISLVFDGHEYFPEVPELQNRPKIKKIWLCLEKMLMPNVKTGYTVSDGIADIYNSKYGKDFKVVRNVPFLSKTDSITGPPSLKLPNNKNVILYQGSLNMGRGLELAIEVMQYIDNAILLIIGDGDIKQELIDYSIKLNLQNKIIFTGRIPLEKLKAYTQLGTIGITLEENLGLNYYYSLPNKFFDYIQAGLPVLISPFPETSKIIKKYNIGEAIEKCDVKHVAEKLNELLRNKKKLEEYSSNAKIAAKELCWENEEKILIKVYSKFRKSDGK
ncbi:MAG: glycosyltransferase [Bacteroidales bacterium]|nr:glycosyltransferase [Bacteroidales bacterium]